MQMFYLTFLYQNTELFGNINVDFYVTDALLTRCSAYIKY